MFEELEDLDFKSFSDKLNEDIKKKIEEGKKIDDLIIEEYGDASLEEVKKELPVTENARDLSLVRYDGVGITREGKLTLSTFFEDLGVGEEYGALAFSAEEIKKISRAMRKRATGPNSVLALTCAGRECSFADKCIYQQLGKAPVGLECLIEIQLLEYHTRKLMNQFKIDPEDYTELMLVQEIAETYVTEMRINMVLAKPENAEMMGIRLKFSPDGEQIQEETAHWAVGQKEKIKDRRMKVLRSFMATREANQKAMREAEKDNSTSYFEVLKKLNDKIESFKLKNIEEAKYEIRSDT